MAEIKDAHCSQNGAHATRALREEDWGCVMGSTQALTLTSGLQTVLRPSPMPRLSVFLWKIIQPRSHIPTSCLETGRIEGLGTSKVFFYRCGVKTQIWYDF